MATKAGYQAILYYGAAGSTASTQVTGAKDIKYDVTPNADSDRSRGDGSSVPIETGVVTYRDVALTFSMVNNPSDTTLTALIAAARAGTAIALRYIPASGGTGLDADCFLSVSSNSPLDGTGVVDFALVKLDKTLRTPALNS